MYKSLVTASPARLVSTTSQTSAGCGRLKWEGHRQSFCERVLCDQTSYSLCCETKHNVGPGTVAPQGEDKMFFPPQSYTL